jgi:outer membrane protein OmpA-like peptidoglycan-associated protein
MKHTILIFLLFFSAAAIAAAGDNTTQVNILSLQEGALPVLTPATYQSWYATNLLDESPTSGWAGAEGNTKNNIFVFELVGTTTLSRVEFDTAARDDDGAEAKEISVEVSNTSPGSGFSPLLSATLAPKADNQKFPVTKAIPARWVKLTIKDNYGNEKWTELFSFRAYAARPVQETPKNISGTYDTTYSAFHISQQGTALNGCYEYNDGLLTGTIEGRVMKLTWLENNETAKGPAVMVFAPDGKSFRGFWWHEEGAKQEPSGVWDGKKTSDEVGGCPHWSGSISGELKKKLSSNGRARLYGILFDTDSAVIKPDSKPILAEIIKMLNAEAGWSLLIEGHTDASGNSSHNQALSQQRAEAVKTQLIAGGIASGRLQTAGFGQSKPVADNGTELGRAQNRRVELVKK